MRKIAVLDLETDPFEYGKVPEPFLAGFYDGDEYIFDWHNECIARMCAILARRSDPLIIYAHNGGRFDFFYFLPHLNQSDIRIVNSRIIQARLGEHELRDSFAIMPFKLASYQKDEIDYNKLHRDVREKHREEIISYLRGDLTYLYELCTAFAAEFGDKLTIGSAAMKEIKSRHKFKCGNELFDARFRKPFYFGGRNQVFRSGIIRGPVKIYDVNSMYPDVMRRFLHPVGTGVLVDKRVKRNTCFVVAEGKNYGAFPVRREDNSLDFTQEHGVFSTTVHEWEAALDTGTFEPTRVIKTYGFDDRITFAEFVDYFYHARLSAKATGDKIRTLFYKFVLNSGYGKFAQNPENYFEWQITGMVSLPDPWTPTYIHQGKYIIWQRPLERKFYYNITTGASITGAARSVLLRGLSAAVNPIYCDTDSIICQSMRGIAASDTELGAWKLEGEGTMVAVAGKKLYAVFDANGKCVKKAHKGARLTGEEIVRIAQGETIVNENPVPAFKFDGTHKFTTRKIRRTA